MGKFASELCFGWKTASSFIKQFVQKGKSFKKQSLLLFIIIKATQKKYIKIAFLFLLKYCWTALRSQLDLKFKVLYLPKFCSADGTLPWNSAQRVTAIQFYNLQLYRLLRSTQQTGYVSSSVSATQVCCK